MRVQLAPWWAAAQTLPCWESPGCRFSRSTEAGPWPAKHDALRSRPTNATASTRSPRRVSPLRVPLFARALSSAVPTPISRPTSSSPQNSTVPRTPSPGGATASSATACQGYVTSRGLDGRGLFPPAERHQVVVLATTQPPESDVPVSHWSLEDLAVKIVQDAHFRDMSR